MPGMGSIPDIPGAPMVPSLFGYERFDGASLPFKPFECLANVSVMISIYKK
jgi:hypothetical protein